MGHNSRMKGFTERQGDKTTFWSLSYDVLITVILSMYRIATALSETRKYTDVDISVASLPFAIPGNVVAHGDGDRYMARK